MTALGFSILIPTWNNLPYLQLLVEGLRANSAFDHQILVHVNEGNDGTAQWLDVQGIAYTQSVQNIGICTAINGLFALANRDLICYFNDDMFPLPGWDVALMREVQRIGHNKFYLSATMIEPRATGNACVVAPHAFGFGVSDFDRTALETSTEKLKRPHWCGSSWPPSLVHRQLWLEIGGYSEEFSPGLYSDPDLSMKLWQAGVREFMGVGDALVYHFMSKSTGRIKLNNGKRQFLIKWGVSASYFTRKVLRQGDVYSGPLPNVTLQPNLKDRLKRLWYGLAG